MHRARCPLLVYLYYNRYVCRAFTSLPSERKSSFCRNLQRSAAGATANMTFPTLAVFDLDACFWDQEMYEMRTIPAVDDIVLGDLNGRGEGVIGVMSGRQKISMHPGSLFALQHHFDGKYGEMKVAFASSADTPFAEQVGCATLKLLEVVPGTTVWDLVVGRDWGGQDVNQIGRQPPLSSNKSESHFPLLKCKTGVRYDQMLFFDDCNWGDHCGMVSSKCREIDTDRGPATVRTPNGLRVFDWENGLDLFSNQAALLTGQASKSVSADFDVDINLDCSSKSNQ